MTGLLTAHLTVEEQYALPLHEAQMQVAEHKRLEARARKDTPRAQARFLIPWLITHASPGQRAALFRSAPPLRLLYWFSLPYYCGFDQALARAARGTRRAGGSWAEISGRVRT
jgi:hypothetical protein